MDGCRALGGLGALSASPCKLIDGLAHETTTETSDETLCQRVAERDEAAFDLLVARYQGRAYRLAWSILRDAEDARDVSQETFVRVYEMAGRFRGESRFSTWFYRILVNGCLDHRRRQRWWRQLVDSADGEGRPLVDRQPAPAHDPGADVEREQVTRRLWDAVEDLSPQQRAAVLLQVQEELSTAEIAAVLECSEATVRVHLHRAVAALRKTIGRS
jgi:RNA polymerase sigma-70 factor (ECF subfamily)